MNIPFKRTNISSRTRKNWLIDAAVFLGGLLAALSGIYFLFLPSGGYQGGRNPMYGVTILFSRDTWDALHTWGGLVMIGVAAVHLALHWPWVGMMSRRTLKALTLRGRGLSRGAVRNIALNVLVASSGLVTAVTGVYLLFAPSGHGSSQAVTWNLVHTWAGVVMIVAAVAHLAIHWRWVKSVTQRLVQVAPRAPHPADAPARG